MFSEYEAALQTSSAPTLDEIAAAAGAADLFLFRRIDADHFAHIGGAGRGTGWAGIVEIGVPEEPLVAEALRTNTIERRHQPEPWHVFGPYFGTAVAIVPVDADIFAVFGSRDESLLRLSDAELRELAAVASESTFEVAPAKRLADELEVVNAVRDLLRTPGGTFDETLQNVVDQAAASLSCELGVLFVPGTQRVASFDPAGLLADQAATVASTLSAVAGRESLPTCIQDAATNDLPSPFSAADGVVSYYLLGIDEPVAAVLLLAHTSAAPRGFTKLCQSLGERLIEAAGPMLLTALTRDGLRDDLERAAGEARHDALTGLANRLAWTEALAAVAADGHPVSVIQFDCRGLKQANDTYGHHVGDRLLRTIGDIALSCVRDGDLVARVGGDEFAILLTDTDETVAASIVARIEQAVATEPPVETIPLAIAIGSATTRDGDAAAAHRDADARMLARKSSLQATDPTPVGTGSPGRV